MGKVTPITTSQQKIWMLTDDQVDLGGSFAVASQGLFATGVTTDLNGILPQTILQFRRHGCTLTHVSVSVTYLNSGGKIGDTLKAVSV